MSSNILNNLQKHIINIYSNNVNNSVLHHNTNDIEWKKMNFVNIDGKLKLEQINKPSDSIVQIENSFIYHDGNETIWKKIDINSNTFNQLDVSRLLGYPNDRSKILLGDGTWDDVVTKIYTDEKILNLEILLKSYIDDKNMLTIGDLDQKISENSIILKQYTDDKIIDNNNIIYEYVDTKTFDNVQNIDNYINQALDNIEIINNVFPEVIPGTFTKLQINNRGLVSLGKFLNSSDIPILMTNKISDFNDKILSYKITDLDIPDKNLDLNNNKIINVSDPTNTQDVVTKKYIDDIFPITNSGTYTKIDVNNRGLITFGKLLNSSDIPNLTTNKISDLDNKIKSFKITDLDKPNKDINLNNNKIINVSDPINTQDAATKKYIDDIFPNITEGTYTKINVNNKGLITLGKYLNSSDIPMITTDKISNLNDIISSYKLTDFNFPNKNLNLNDKKIINVLGPSDNKDVVNKEYVDNVINNIQSNKSFTINKLIINEEPIEEKNCGYIIKRYDLLNDIPYEQGSIQNVNLEENKITISNNADQNDDYYLNWYIKIINLDQLNSETRQIIKYDGINKEMTLNQSFTITSGIYLLFNKPYTGLFYSSKKDKFYLGYSALEDEKLFKINELATLKLNCLEIGNNVKILNLNDIITLSSDSETMYNFIPVSNLITIEYNINSVYNDCYFGTFKGFVRITKKNNELNISNIYNDMKIYDDELIDTHIQFQSDNDNIDLNVIGKSDFEIKWSGYIIQTII